MAREITNSRGVPHLHVHADIPSAEASELKDHVESMRGKNTDHEGVEVFNPKIESRAQQRAMFAARSGKSNIGIPQSVGREMTRPYVGKPGSLSGLPKRAPK